ncbi:hypothetical protein K490DRAFT_52590 [Saccharata proteae CBS 121410]|uniref:Uncharacterized protein n=1 Tax=Saccharata proteae CBS 121410 TaxID=1314787 RepID=A0A9P4I3W1_9PEZI|nr:hypothetical protein K490DRAFT_52590 [Saccharata proteae CBS 121410]
MIGQAASIHSPQLKDQFPQPDHRQNRSSVFVFLFCANGRALERHFELQSLETTNFHVEWKQCYWPVCNCFNGLCSFRTYEDFSHAPCTTSTWGDLDVYTSAVGSIDDYPVDPPKCSISPDDCQYAFNAWENMASTLYGTIAPPNCATRANSSDSVYILYEKATAHRLCSSYPEAFTTPYGSSYPGALITMKSSDLSSICSLQEMRYGWPATSGTAFPFNFGDLNHPVPNSAYQCQTMCGFNWPASECPLIVEDRFSPQLAVPDAIRSLDPAWSTCVLDLEGATQTPRLIARSTYLSRLPLWTQKRVKRPVPSLAVPRIHHPQTPHTQKPIQEARQIHQMDSVNPFEETSRLEKRWEDSYQNQYKHTVHVNHKIVKTESKLIPNEDPNQSTINPNSELPSDPTDSPGSSLPGFGDILSDIASQAVASNDPDQPLHPLATDGGARAPPIATLGTNTIFQDPSDLSQLLIGTHTVLKNAVTIIDNQLISVASGHIILLDPEVSRTTAISTITFATATPGPNAAFSPTPVLATIGSRILTLLPDTADQQNIADPGAIIVDGTETLAPGAATTATNGVVISVLQPDKANNDDDDDNNITAVIINPSQNGVPGTTSTLTIPRNATASAAASPPPTPILITLPSETLTLLPLPNPTDPADPTGIKIDNTRTLTPGAVMTAANDAVISVLPLVEGSGVEAVIIDYCWRKRGCRSSDVRYSKRSTNLQQFRCGVQFREAGNSVGGGNDERSKCG